MRKTDGNQVLIGDHIALTITPAISADTNVRVSGKRKVGNMGVPYISLKKGTVFLLTRRGLCMLA